MEPEIAFTLAELEAAFTAWERDVRAHPDGPVGGADDAAT